MINLFIYTYIIFIFSLKFFFFFYSIKGKKLMYINNNSIKKKRWLNGITDSMDMNLGELWEMVMGRKA